MALATMLLYVIVTYVRPGEVIPGWVGFPFAAITETVATIAVVVSLMMRPRAFWNEPHDRYLLGFFAATLVSNIAWGWFGGAYLAVVNTGSQLLCYFLLRAVIRTPRDLRWVGYCLVAATLFQASNGISQFRTGLGLGGVSAIDMRGVDADDDGLPDEVRRIRGTGIFNDPNDLAMAFVAIMPLLVGPILRRRSSLPVRGIATTVLSPILAAFYYTNSRGGMLGLGAALMPYCLRFGKVLSAIAAGLAVTALLALGPSRMGQMETEDSSAQGRVQSWSEGLQMFKSKPIFGVGYGRYTDFNRLVAHNSFVHSLAELGIVGAFCFTGMIYWMFRGTRRVRRIEQQPVEVQRLSEWGDDLRRGAIGLCVCALFLSRQYSSVLFNCLALCASYSQLVQEVDPTDGERASDVAIVAGATVGGIVVIYVFVRVFALWGG